MASPLPLALASWSAGAAGAGIGLAAGLAVAGLLTGPIGAAVYASQFGLGACLLGLAVRTERPPQAVVGAFAAATTVAFWALLGLLAVQAGKTPLEMVDQTVQASLAQARDLLLRSASGADADAALAVRQWAATSGRFLVRAFPGLLIAFGILVGWVNAVVLRRVLRSRGHPLPAWNTWRLGEHWIWLLIGSGLLALLGGGWMSTVGFNAFIPAVAAYFLQGLAIVQHLFETKAFPRPLRGLTYLLLFVQFPIMLLVAGVGAFDLWVDFRSRWSSPPPPTSAAT
jgi:uncharacterized protein YybS (DUF2232 family)